MPVQVSYPGVYINEFTPAAPIQGVGTSTAAFIGVNAIATPYLPTLITSWDGFLAKFSDGSPPDDADYLWYAVRGFFVNGGKVCFVTAVSNASPDHVLLDDESAQPTVVIKARQRGVLSPPISVSAAPANAVPVDPLQPAKLFEPTATIATTSADKLSVDVGDPVLAANFLGGDHVLLGTGAASEEATVSRVSGTLVFFTAALQGTFTNKPLRLARLVPFATSFRVENAQGLTTGSIVTLSQSGATSQTTVVKSVAVERISTTVTTYRVTVQDGINGFTLYKTGNKPITLQSQEFSLTVSGLAQPYDMLSMNPGHPRYYVNVINNDPAGSVTAAPYDPPNTTAVPANRPSGTYTLSGGSNFDAAAIRAAPLPFYSTALAANEGIADINIVAVPDTTDEAVQIAVKDHCTNLADRFAILDAKKGTALADIPTQRVSLESDKGFCALYYPWIEVASQVTGQLITVPPSGYVAGIYARTDNNRGVHKAPAGTEATISGALGVEQLFSNADQGFVNLKGINVIRVFQHGGAPVVWGARTTSSNTNWQYVNIRRLFIFLEESIQQGIRGSVFEPNNQVLWQKLKRTLGAFLTQQWRDGALFGNKPEEAFYVRIDEVLNPDSERALGRLTIEIGVRPSYPAEFIIVRIGIWQGGSSVSES
jgi:phage tail sheath protein FI